MKIFLEFFLGGGSGKRDVLRKVGALLGFYLISGAGGLCERVSKSIETCARARLSRFHFDGE